MAAREPEENIMQYALLIHEDEKLWDSYTPEQQGEVMQGYATFSQYLVDNDHMRGGERLQPSHTATTVRVRDGEVALSDGPFAETKEQFGGLYLVDAADLDEATKLAAMIPTAAAGCVEVRPIWLMED
ncbi:MAG: YciI family protein [Pseudomonadales bacterium]